MSSDKRSVHTDALHTLGSIIGEGEKRDAIHVAVEPCVAAQTLMAGEHVGRLADGSFGKTLKPLGVVDPFLGQTVLQGERFWLLIYPREITSLRHVWAHPEFPDAVADTFAQESAENFENHADDVVVVDRKAESEAWLQAVGSSAAGRIQGEPCDDAPDDACSEARIRHARRGLFADPPGDGFTRGLRGLRLMTCPHRRMRSIVLFLEPTESDQLRRAVFTIQCHQCGAPFEFAGVAEGPGITISADRRELRVAITEAAAGRIQ